VFEFKHHDIFLTEIAKEYGLEDVKKATGCEFNVVNNLKSF